MKLKSGVVDTKGYIWNVNVEEQFNEALKEGFENMLKDSSPYVYFKEENGVMSLNVMLDYFSDMGNPLIFTEPLREIFMVAEEMECLSFLKNLRKALARNLEMLDKVIAAREGEEE